MSGERTKATVTLALQEFIARREQAAILDLFGTLDWDEGFDYRLSARADERSCRHNCVVAGVSQGFPRRLRLNLMSFVGFWWAGTW